MLARSYGGTQMYNWAAEHPESVACLAGIYPVCNLASYPGMKSAAGKYRMSEEQLAKELTEKHGLTSKGSMLTRRYGGTQMYNCAAEHPESAACLAGT